MVRRFSMEASFELKKYTEKKVAADNFIKLASRRMYLLVLYLKVNNDNEYKV